jgi:hypothetical protein
MGPVEGERAAMLSPATSKKKVLDRASPPSAVRRSSASSCAPGSRTPGTVPTTRPSFQTDTGAVAPPMSSRVFAPP